MVMTEIKSKRCPKCGIEKPIDEFTKSKSRKDGHYCYCKECSRKQNNSINLINVSMNTDEVLSEFAKNNPYRKCNKCKEIKPISEFIICRQRKDGYETCCKECQHKQYGNNVGMMTDERLAEIAIEKPFKKCVDCGKIKPMVDFPICRENIDGRHFYCNDCQSARMVKYYQNTIEYRIEYRNKNKEYSSKRYRKYNEMLKVEVLTHYGNGKCSCVICGESRIACLSIDHINGGGSKHRKSLNLHGGGGVRFYKWLKDNKFPENYRTLCMNCQFIEAFGRKHLTT